MRACSPRAARGRMDLSARPQRCVARTPHAARSETYRKKFAVAAEPSKRLVVSRPGIRARGSDHHTRILGSMGGKLGRYEGGPEGEGGSVRARFPSILIHRFAALNSSAGRITHGPLEGTASRVPPRARCVGDGLSRAKRIM